MSTQEAISKILQENGNRPMHYREITQQAMAKGYYQTTGKTPESSVGAVLATRTDIFEKCETNGAGYYSLKNYKTPEKTAPAHDKGFVYILTNPSFREDWVKIGKSARPVDVRSKELDNTAVPLPFEIYATLKTEKYEKVEKLVHKTIDRLTDLRIRKNREFFNVKPDKALEILKDIAETIDDAEIDEVYLHKNDWRTNDVAHEATPTYEKSPTEPAKHQRPPFKFSMVNIAVGSIVTFVPTNTNVRVASDNQIEYNGKLYKLSAFTRDFIPADKRNESGAYQGAKYFSYNDKILDDLRTEVENNLMI